MRLGINLNSPRRSEQSCYLTRKCEYWPRVSRSSHVTLFLYRLGFDPLTIQAVGDWSSDTFLRYLEVNFDRLWAAQAAMGSFALS